MSARQYPRGRKPSWYSARRSVWGCAIKQPLRNRDEQRVPIKTCATKESDREHAPIPSCRHALSVNFHSDIIDRSSAVY
jgi:hypothetical protein